MKKLLITMFTIVSFLTIGSLVFWACQNKDQITLLKDDASLLVAQSKNYDQLKNQNLETFITNVTVINKEDNSFGFSARASFFYTFPQDDQLRSALAILLDKNNSSNSLDGTEQSLVKIETITSGDKSYIIKLMSPSLEEKKEYINKVVIPNGKPTIETLPNGNKISDFSSLSTGNSKAKISANTATFSSYTDVVAAFNYVKGFSCVGTGQMSCIPYRYIKDGCYARAHAMKSLIESNYPGKTVKKIFSLGSLSAKSSTYNCCVNWGYHVAPLLYVGTIAYVLDPSMFSSPVSTTTWQNAQITTTNCKNSGFSSSLSIWDGSAYTPIVKNGVMTSYTTDLNNTNTNSILVTYSAKTGCNGYGLI